MTSLNQDDISLLRQTVNTSDPWEIAGHVGIPFPRYVKAVKRLKRRGLLKVGKDKVTLTAEGRQTARDLQLRTAKDIAQAVQKARKEFLSITKNRPSAAALHNQGYMTIFSLFRRAELIADLGDADGKRVAILGDDDLLSIALCLACRPESVTVFEIDERVVDFIDRTARDRGLPITAEQRDLRDPLPARFRARFDTFVTDPSETIAGLKMFVGRGLCLLRSGKGRAGYFGLTSIEASVWKWHKLQKWMLDGYLITLTHIIPGSAYYYNWPDLVNQTEMFNLDCLNRKPSTQWFNSALVRLETIEGFRPRKIGKVSGRIFMDDEAVGKIREEPR
jgi:hypothetical protein